MIQSVFAIGKSNKFGEYAFGNKNGLPWGHIRQDMINFKKRTTEGLKEFGNPAVVMGWNTFKSLPEPLFGRVNVVISNDVNSVPVARNGASPDSVIAGMTLKDVCQQLEMKHGVVSVIGGAGLIKESLDFVDRVVLTYIHKDNMEYDVAFPLEWVIPITQNFINETHTNFDISKNVSMIETVLVRAK